MMHVVFLKDHDGYKKEQDCYIEVTLGRRLCRQGICVPAMLYKKENPKEVPPAPKVAKKETANSKLAEKREKKIMD